MKEDQKSSFGDLRVTYRTIEFENKAIKEFKIPMDLGARLGVNFLLRLEWDEESDRDHSSEFAIVFLYNS